MSAKWVRSKQWDDQHLRGPLLPVKWVLRAFSSITLAVCLLTLVAIYGMLASIPIGMVAQIPTVLVYALSLVATVAVAACLPAWAVGRALRARGVDVLVRWCGVTAAGLVLVPASVWGWMELIWPHLRYSYTTGQGLMFFAEFVERYKATTVRRLPGLEMSELEFYSWWPLTLVLLAFVVNMVTATVRRIEFSLPYLGVLTVHTGIVVIAIGSVYYGTLKQEGDMILLSGGSDDRGHPTVGDPQVGFYDNTEPVLWLNQGKSWEQRTLSGLPRYNAYGLHVLGDPVGPGGADDDRPLSQAVPESNLGLIDADVRFRVVGYAPYARLEERWKPFDERTAPAGRTGEPSPIRFLELVSRLPRADQPASAAPAEPNVDVIPMVPGSPRDRLALLGPATSAAAAIEYTRGMPQARWQALAADLPEGAMHALRVQIPDEQIDRVVAITPGQTVELSPKGWWLQVREITPTPPLPIITPGYENAMTSVAIVRVVPPAGADGTGPAPFDRYLYHRFPEIAQDLVENRGATGELGQPKRRGADSAITLTFIDASIVQIYLDEVVEPSSDAAAGAGAEAAATGPDATTPEAPTRVRALVRFPGQTAARVIDSLGDGDSVPLGEMVSLRLGQRWARAERVQVPVLVPERERERDQVGNHRAAALALEVTVLDPQRPGAVPLHKAVLWVPFSQYIDIAPEQHRVVTLPDGRSLTVAFGRRFHPFPDLAVQLADFEMIPYPHSTTPRDYRSDLVVIRNPWEDDRRTQESASTSLNAPLKVTVPFRWTSDRPAAANVLGWLVNWVAPNQFKFSQVGWDSGTWSATREAVERGELERPFARFTILGVGNNPGIYVIAAGAVMMSVGIPWAFYLKPYFMQRRKRAIQRALAEGTYQRPGGPAAAAHDQGPAVRVVAGRVPEPAARNGHAHAAPVAAASAPDREPKNPARDPAGRGGEHPDR